MEEPRIIKRYTNRRLYDTHTSSYITLDDIQKLVLKQIKFKIIDEKTSEDLTNYMLLQIISLHENEKLPIFTTDVLENIIRFYGHPMQKMMSQILEQSFANMDIWQSSFSEYFNKTGKNTHRKKL